jgi:Bacterial HORMA domain family 1
MSYSTTITNSVTFTLTHARYLASKVATDLKRMQRFYGKPSDTEIVEYELELANLLKAGYLGTIAYGFKKDGNWVTPTLRYTASQLNGLSPTDDDPGRVPPGADATGAVFHSYLTYSTSWDLLTAEQQSQFKRSLPFARGAAHAPGVKGYFADDRTYSAGGRNLGRASLKD